MQSSPQTSDEALVLGALLGNPRAFDALVGRFRGAVLFVAQQELGGREAAEDVAQEAFLLAFRALPQLQHPAKFAGWLYAITRRRAQRVGVQERRTEPAEPAQLESLLAQRDAPAVSPIEVCVQNGERNDVAAALQQLPPDYRTVLHLRYYEEWPVARIAAFLSLPNTTVHWRLHHGRDLLRRRLSEQRENQSHEHRQSEQCGAPSNLSHVA